VFCAMSSPQQRKNSLTKRERQHTGHRAAKPGVPKKEGAGGKGTWGKEGSEIYAVPRATDPNDPNYDSEDDDFIPRFKPPTPLELFKAATKNILDEYFVSGDADEVVRALSELDHEEFHHEFVKAVISRSLDLHDRERELASELLPRLYPDIISHDKIVEGFTLLLERIEDLKLDIPNAPELLSMFLARAVVDDLLPPAFLSPDSADIELAKEILLKAKSLIQGKRAFKRVTHIWGAAGEQSVKRFKERVLSILEEYLVSNDIVEADRAIRELDAPSFHYYIVKKAVIFAIDYKDIDRDKLLNLLTVFDRSGLISERHMVAGFKSCVDDIEDIEIDAPQAREVLKQFIESSIEKGFLPTSFYETYKQALK
jgi:hypothetical protein